MLAPPEAWSPLFKRILLTKFSIAELLKPGISVSQAKRELPVSSSTEMPPVVILRKFCLTYWINDALSAKPKVGRKILGTPRAEAMLAGNVRIGVAFAVRTLPKGDIELIGDKGRYRGREGELINCGSQDAGRPDIKNVGTVDPATA